MTFLPFAVFAEELAVRQTFDCLDLPIADNLAFNMCLSPLEQLAFVELIDDAIALQSLAQETNIYSQTLGERVTLGLSDQKTEAFRQALNAELGSMYSSCVIYETIIEQSTDDLALARCNMVAEFATLHFLYDNYYAFWRPEE